jgi:hypothetical protein
MKSLTITPEDEETLEILGELFMFSFSTYPQYPLGDRFYHGMFKSINLLDISNIKWGEGDPTNDIAAFTSRLYLPLTDPSDEIAIHHFIQIIKQPLDKFKEIKDCIQYFVDLGIVSGDKPKEIQDELKEYYEPIIRGKIAPLFVIARGILNTFPLLIRLDEGNHIFERWDELGHFTSEEWVERIQGHLSKEAFINVIKVEGGTEQQNRDMKQWAVNWINKQPKDLITCANVLETITNAPVASSTIIINICYVPEIGIHTCYRSIDVPVNTTEEDLHKKFDKWGAQKLIHHTSV